jgi:MFS family permease
MTSETPQENRSWLNATTLGVGFTSLLSDWSHEIATAILPGFLAALGAGPGWLGVIEGTADGLSSAAKLISGHFTDRLKRRKPLAVAGYVVTAAATGALAFAASAMHVLLARVAAWLGRGVRTPGRKALLAAAVPAEAYGRAFGFERMMDTLGAIGGPLTALWLLERTAHNYKQVFLWTLVPGFLAVLSFAFLVRDRSNAPRPQLTFREGLRALPSRFRWFLLAVGVFGLGDFAHSLLILYATQALTPAHGRAAAASIAIGLYLLHNGTYAASAYLGGWLGDRAKRRSWVLAAGYAIAAAMAALLVTGPHTVAVLAAVFLLAGVFVGVEEALEDSMAAELVSSEQHGMAFGTLATVNAVGDFASSVTIGLLWTSASPTVAFGLAGALFVAGSLLVLRLPGRA